MRILVADDEALVRYGIVSVLQDILTDPPVIIEASNGRELVERVRESRPHIALVDIRMPEMDGLEAIASAREYAPGTLWAIVSGHGDFTYARRAMKLGVEDFLLKPVDPDELKELLSRLAAKAADRQRRGNRDLEARVSAVLGNTTSPADDPWFARPRFWQAGMILWDSLLSDTDNAARRRAYAGRLQEILDDGDDYSGCVVSCAGDALLVVFSIPTGGLPAASDTSFWWSFGSRVSGGLPMDMVIALWHRRFESLRAAGREMIPEGIGDTWLLSRVVQDPGELFREIADLGREAVLRYIHRPSGLMEYADVVSRSGSSRFHTVADLLEEMKNTLLFGAEDDFHGAAHKLEDLAGKMNGHEFVDGGPAWYARYAVPLAPPAPDNLIDLARRLRDAGHELFSGRTPASPPGSSPETLAERALEVMNRRYRETIGIVQVADELGVTPNYLSTVFKKEIGSSFTGKLTEMRLEKSLELLSRSDANVGDAARSLGYQSSRHFTRLFKEKYSVTPSQWMADRRK